ncbi:MAG: sel1 repeat family protein [Akkermansia sp.]|nr:sel1 repeat family protein [Akkermansia sp.]
MKLLHLIPLPAALLLCSCGINSTAQIAAKAADGDSDACYEYGHNLLTGRRIPQNKERALHWLLIAADKGNIRAAAALGACYARGIGTPPNTELARRWYTIAADAGHPHAQMELAKHYLNVDPKDPAEAVTYLRYAAMDGSADAAFLMSICFSQGIGVPQHQKIALGWLVNAAELGNDLACQILKDLANDQQNDKKS